MSSFNAEKYSIDIITDFGIVTLDDIHSISMNQPESDMFATPNHKLKSGHSMSGMDVIAYMSDKAYKDMQQWMHSQYPRDINVYIGSGLLSIAKNTHITDIRADLSYDSDKLKVTFSTKSTSIAPPTEGELRAQRIKQGIKKFHHYTK
jgi:hypothetical protein